MNEQDLKNAIPHLEEQTQDSGLMLVFYSKTYNMIYEFVPRLDTKEGIEEVLNLLQDLAKTIKAGRFEPFVNKIWENLEAQVTEAEFESQHSTKQ